MNIRDIVQKSDTAAGRAFDLFVLLLIVFSIITLSVETLPDLPPTLAYWLYVSEVVVTFLFTLEYILRVFTIARKRDYIFSFYGMIDLVAILPFYLSLVMGLFGIDLRFLRVLRLLRIFRIFKLVRYNDAFARLCKAVIDAKEEFLVFLLLLMLLIFLSSAGIYYFEHQAQPEKFSSIPHSLWWSLITLTTVGYGDVYPVTLGGKLFTFVILICGLGIVAVPAGIVAAALSKVTRQEEKD